MKNAKVLKVRVTYFDKYGDSGLRHFTVASKEKLTDDALYALGIYSYHCRCAHDCCGHGQCDSPIVERRNKRNEWYVTQHWYRNV